MGRVASRQNQALEIWYNELVKYVLIGVIVIVLAFVGYLAFKNPDLLQVQVTPNPQNIDAGNWNTYTNSKYGFQVSYPPSFVLVEEGRFAGHDEIQFGSDSRKDTSIVIDVYDTASTNIKSIPDIPYSNKKSVTLSEDIISNNTSIRIVQRTKNPNESGEPIGADILFIYGSNAYDIQWTCLRKNICFDDNELKKMATSVTFSK